MKRELNKRALILSLVLFALFINLTLISAAPIDDIKSFFSWASSGFSGANFELYSAQTLLFILVTLILYAISDAVPFLSDANEWLKGLICLIVGILSVFFLAPEQIFTAMTGYKALGIMLTTLIPLAFLMGLTLKWNTKKPEYSWVSAVFWIGFLVAYFLLYGDSLIAYLYGNPDPHGLGTFGVLYIAFVGLISFLFLFMGGYISRWWFTYRLKKIIVKGKLRTQAEVAGKIATLENYKIAAPELAADYNTTIKGLRRLISKGGLPP
ncbi:MAG: hypothetical protein AABX54_03515 [Nanoarchaeota archaeon]